MNNLSKVNIPKYNKLLPDFLYNRGHSLLTPNNKKMHNLLSPKIRKTFSNLQTNNKNFSDVQMKYISLEEENVSILSNLFSLLKEGWEDTIQSLPQDTQKQLNNNLRVLQELHNTEYTKKMFGKTNKKVNNKSISELVENVQEILKTDTGKHDKDITQLNKESKPSELKDSKKSTTDDNEEIVKEITEKLTSEQDKTEKLTKELYTEQNKTKELTTKLGIEQQNTLKINKIEMDNKTLKNNLEFNSKEVKTLESEYKKTTDMLVSLGILSTEDSSDHPIVKNIVDKVMKEDREAIKKLKNELLAAGGLSPLLLLAGLLGKGLSDLKGLFKGASLAGKMATAAKAAKSLLKGAGGAAAKVVAGATAILAPTEMGGKEEDDRVSKAGALTAAEASRLLTKPNKNYIKKAEKPTEPSNVNANTNASTDTNTNTVTNKNYIKKAEKPTEPSNVNANTNASTDTNTNTVTNTLEKSKEPLKIVAPKIPDGKNATPSVIDNSGQTNANNVTVNNINMNNKQEPSSSSTSFSEMLGLDSAKAKILQALK